MPEVASGTAARAAQAARRRRSRVRGAGALLLLTLTALPACGGPASGDDDGSPEAMPSASASASGAPTVAHVGLLTGLPVAAGVDRRTAVAVVVSGSGASTGVNIADTVYVEMGSAATSRAVALYQSRDTVVGPVGETRPVDARILPVLHPVTVYTGGAVGQVDQIRKSGVVDAGLGTLPALYTRRPDGTLTVDTAAVRRSAPQAKPPVIPFTFADPGEKLAAADTSSAKTFRVAPAGQPPMTWTYDARLQRWTTTAQLGGVSVPLFAASVLVQQVEFKTANSRAAPVPVAGVYGNGKLTAVSKDVKAEGSWGKSGVQSATLYRDSTGAPLRLAPGPVVVLLVPAGSTVG